MEYEEFSEEMEKLDAGLQVYQGRGDEDKRRKKVRWLTTFDTIEEFPIRVFREARKRLCRGGCDDGKRFPTCPEIYEACQEVYDEMSAKPPVQYIAKFQPAPHTCAVEKPTLTDALRRVSFVFPAVERYESKHIVCQGEIPATCPQCGAQEMVTEPLRALAGDFPLEQTVGWNLCMKGLCLCRSCSASMPK